MYDKLVSKVNNINTSDFVLKTKYSADKKELENKISGISNLVKKTDYNTKITELENKILGISNLATKTALTAVDNDLSYYRGKRYFDEGSSKQNYLLFLPIDKYFTLNSVVDHRIIQ